MPEGVFSKLKGGLDWLQHGYLIVQILIGLGTAKFVQASLATFTSLPGVWITPIWLISFGVIVAVFVWLGNIWNKLKNPRDKLTVDPRDGFRRRNTPIEIAATSLEKESQVRAGSFATLTALAYDLLDFLRNFGPTPLVNTRQEIPWAIKANLSRIPRLHDAFMNRFHTRVEKEIYALGEINLRDWKLNEIVNQEAFSDSDIQAIAVELLELRNKLELREHGIPITWVEVDKMSADEYKERCKDPDSCSQVDALPPKRTTSQVRLLISSPGISFRITSDRKKAVLDLLFFTNAAVELTYIKVIASIGGQEICTFVESEPIQFSEIGEYRRMIATSITAPALEKISLGREVSLFGKVAFHHGITLKEEPIKMVTVADIGEFAIN